MREITQGLDVTGVAKLYPKVSKVTVDDDGQKAYVFIGRNNRAMTITGAEYDTLVGLLPPAVEDSEPDGGEKPEESNQTAETKPDAFGETKTPAPRGKKEK